MGAVASGLQIMRAIAPFVEEELSEFKARCYNVDIDQKHSKWHIQPDSPGVIQTFSSFDLMCVTKDCFPIALTLLINDSSQT